MSASEQDTPAAEAPEDDDRSRDQDPERNEGQDAERDGGRDPDAERDEDPAGAGGGLTPKQARRLRVAAASVLLVAMAVVLAVRLASRTSVLVVGVYGLAMILCGVVIELSRNGRTRLGTWLLVGGLLAALAFDWLILP
ncbi:hypothetical protein [Streptomyces sp.]|uniref:hypothetical protein n=1 Tax=Streptomyces sp. TaxID=1931 RepID=UPI002810F402|nr:hypothetical protein [Streptomyces sp.]